MAERHLFLGQALARQGRMDEARAVLLRAEQLDPAALRQKQEELVARGYLAGRGRRVLAGADRRFRTWLPQG